LTLPTGTDDWDAHWGHYAESAEANPAQRYRFRLILSRLRLIDSARLVDIGSGQGDFAAQVRRRWPRTEILGIELSETGCAAARRKVPGATFLQRDLLKGEETPPTFHRWATHAVCSEVLEHVDRPDLLLHHASAWLAPRCRVIVTVPGGPMSAYDRHIGHRRHYTNGTLREVLERGGLEVGWVAAAGFPFHNLYRLAVLARGEKLIRDVAGPPATRFMLGVMRAFDLAFRLNLPASPWGWQLIAVARLPR
jgi:SAM-dependent methyltransferase